MKTANQLTFATYEASLRLNPNDPVKIIFDTIDWSFVHSLAKGKYSSQGAEGYDPVCLFKAQLLIYLGEVSSNRKLASALVYNTRLCLLCGFNFLETPYPVTVILFLGYPHQLIQCLGDSFGSGYRFRGASGGGVYFNDGPEAVGDLIFCPGTGFKYSASLIVVEQGVSGG